MILDANTVKAHALTWWKWWSCCHPNSNWDTFITALLWSFKPEWRPILQMDYEEEKILPMDDEEEEILLMDDEEYEPN
ncbi:hypothetical protein RYX36_019927 [Vicia faba]